jgi:hypothetical protein
MNNKRQRVLLHKSPLLRMKKKTKTPRRKTNLLQANQRSLGIRAMSLGRVAHLVKAESLGRVENLGKAESLGRVANRVKVGNLKRVENRPTALSPSEARFQQRKKFLNQLKI